VRTEAKHILDHSRAAVEAMVHRGHFHEFAANPGIEANTPEDLRRVFIAEAVW